MDNIRRFPNRRLIEREAADWLARLDSDKALEPFEKEVLSEWLARSPVHREALHNLNGFWRNNILTELMVPLGRHDSRSKVMPHGGHRSFVFGSFATAIFCVLAFTAISTLYFSEPAFENNGLYVTAVGQQKTLDLDDGSQIQLNTNSQVEVEYGDQYRNIRLLQGEAHFDVAKNPDRPFRVYAGSGRVQAIGTAFTVQIAPAGVNVLVTEGRIALASLGGTILDETLMEDLDKDPFVHTQSKELATLDAGESVFMGIEDNVYLSQLDVFENIEIVDESELSRRQSWREGLLVFSGEPLEQVVSEISRYTTLSIEIVDPDLKGLQIGGRFRVGDLDNMFAALETNFGIEVERVNYNQVELKAAK